MIPHRRCTSRFPLFLLIYKIIVSSFLRPRPLVSGYFWLCNFFSADPNIFTSTRNVFKSNYTYLDSFKYSESYDFVNRALHHQAYELATRTFSYPEYAFLLVSVKDWPQPQKREVAVEVLCHNSWRALLFRITENAQKSRKSVIRGIPALAVVRVRVLGADQKKSGPWGGERRQEKRQYFLSAAMLNIDAVKTGSDFVTSLVFNTVHTIPNSLRI